MHSLASDARLVAQCENGVKSRKGTPTWCTVWLVLADFLHREIRISSGDIRLGPIAARLMSSSNGPGNLFLFCHRTTRIIQPNRYSANNIFYRDLLKFRECHNRAALSLLVLSIAVIAKGLCALVMGQGHETHTTLSLECHQHADPTRLWTQPIVQDLGALVECSARLWR